jgi:DNA polymerase I
MPRKSPGSSGALLSLAEYCRSSPGIFRYTNRMTKRKKLLLIDGNAVFHRAYHAIRYLSNSEGEPTNAIYGFAQMLLKAYADLKPDYAVLAWDKSKTAGAQRKALFADYKATRKKMPDDFYKQIDYVREFAKALHLPFIEMDGYEADDIIGTLVHKHKDLNIIVLTNDRDSFQLLDDAPEVAIYLSIKGMTDTTIMDAKGVMEKYGIEPNQIIDMKALGGDSSDNIPGVPGIGEKGAQNLLAKYKTLDGVYEHLDEITGSVHDKLVAGKESAYLSQKLATIFTDAPVDLNLKDAVTGSYDRVTLHELFRKLGFKNLMSRLPAEMSYSATPSLFDEASDEQPTKDRAHLAKVKYQAVTSESELQLLVAKLMKTEVFAFDTETTSVDSLTADLVGMSFCFKEGEAYYVPVGHKEGSQLDRDKTVAALKPALENEKIGKVGHNIKFDYEVMHRYGVKLAPIAFDTMVAGFILNPLARSQTLDDLAYSELGIEMIHIEELLGKKGKDQKSFDQVPIDQAVTYAAEDADVAWRLYEKLAPEVNKGGFQKLVDLTEWPLIPVLAEMEITGIELDSKHLKDFSKVINKRILELEQSIWKLAGEQFNISSPAQLQDILFNKLKISTQGVKKGKTGYSTAVGELEKMRGVHPMIDLIFEYRELTKLKSTYVDTLPEQVAADGRLHTSYSQTIAQTGRLSSNNPNLQNIPIRTELGREIRKAFVAPKGRVFVSADYSQIELRVAAALSKDKGMIETFKKGIDLHIATAAELYNVPLDKVTKEQRSAVKAINFGVLYGMSPHGLSVATGMTREEAVGFIKRYFEVRKGLADYIEHLKQIARKQEYTETLLGRRRPCPEINSNNYVISQSAERYAVNVPLQGTAADIMKLAMIELDKKLDESSPMLLQIHDELIVETDKDKGEAVAKLMKETMENVYDLGVPIDVETSIGTSWGDLK